ncbi:MAG: isocitrate lyase/phosphoenolpyruvate mutase family protein [Pseudomonadota bacterium]
MQQQARAQTLAALHAKGNPLVLYNAWDAGSAQAIARTGAKVVATSSWAMAAAQGYEDGESIPFALVATLIERIAQTVTLPLSVDVEGGYSEDPAACAENVGRLLDLGVVGINLEDRVVGGAGLHDTARQSERIAAIRRMADARGIALFINARTDVFFGSGIAPQDALGEALARAAAYAEAGASGLFVPGLVDLEQIGALCAATPLPVNVMVSPGLPELPALAAAGVARVSHGPGPYLQAMEALRGHAGAAFA